MLPLSLKNPKLYILFALTLFLYIGLGYLTARENFAQLITLSSVLFLFYLYINSLPLTSIEVTESLLFSILTRISLLFMVPNFSDDYFRFIWDGRLFTHGINPFSVLPSAIVDMGNTTQFGLSTQLYNSLNSQHYFTIYPPVLQFIFLLSAKLFPQNILGSIVIMRLFIIAAEAGTVFLIKRVLKLMNLPEKSVLLYALNPLIIIELTGNLHFEAFMIFFLLLSIVLLYRKKMALSAVAFAFSICSKLLPILFLPLLLRRIGLMQSIKYYLICGVVSLLLFVTFIDVQTLQNLSSSVNLYFQKFEFNASIFYIIRWIGFKVVGYDIIHKAGLILSLITLASVLLIAIFQKRDFKSIFSAMLFSLTIYFMFASIVHPWYVSTLVFLTIFTRWRYALLWSYLILFSYFTYRSIPYMESAPVVILEYLCLLSFFSYELLRLRKTGLPLKL